MKILKLIISLFGVKLVDVVVSSISCLKEFFSYKKQCLQDQKQKNEDVKDKEFIEKAENIVNNGTLQDLMNLQR